MEKYELMVIFKPLLPEESRENLQEKFDKILEKNDVNANILETDVWGKRHLAYEIKGYDEGYYIVYNMEFDPSTIKAFEEYLRLNSDVLRYLLIHEDKV
jgi:small subunit ribosomal protein S6